MKKGFLFFAFALIASAFGRLYAQNEALWLRYPAISPDGKTIAFGYKGDIYKVSVEGGLATPLTMHSAQDMMPVWSRDGKMIAFASDRHGNFDVFVIPASGGEAIRLTHHSSGDFPYDFSTDGSEVLFGSSRMQPASSVRFYSPRLFQNLYSVSVKGGRPKLVSAVGAEHAHFNSKGDAIVFQDRKGYEDPWRKHHTSSVTRDLWIHDLKSGTFRQLSGFNGEDREPVLSSDDKHLFYLSEKNGTQNLFKLPLVTREAEMQLTDFKDHPVRHLSISSEGTLCFTWDGSIYTLKEGAKPVKVKVAVMNDGRANQLQNVPITG
ncbi:MAG: peptidase S41, partial [Chitinophagaceae bacterium]|nr:peptidase S41 [Chitinophagaceae bacterium]